MNSPVQSDANVQQLRHALGTFLTGVTVVTAMAPDGTLRGFTANSFTSVSLEPPLLLVCISESNGSYPIFKRCDTFAVNILAASQQSLARVFASSGKNKYEGISYRRERMSAPVIEGSLAWFECAIYRRLKVGDHLILIGSVVSVGAARTAAPLGYFSGNYVDVSSSIGEAIVPPRHLAALRLGWIFEHPAGGILLVKEQSSDGQLTWTIPTSGTLPEGLENDWNAFQATRYIARAVAQIDVGTPKLYSVYHMPDGTTLLVYRACIESDLSLQTPEYKMLTLEEIPWSAISYRHIRNMLRRYCLERRRNRFGIYVGPNIGGVVEVPSNTFEWDDYMVDVDTEDWRS